MKPRLLDLFCGAGGAAMGYHRAGFEVVGVDLKPQPNYPFEFIQTDALLFLMDEPVIDYAAIHASPPCQLYSQGTVASDRSKHPDLVAPTRRLLQKTRLPYVIENVPRAPLISPVVVCGAACGCWAQDDDGSILVLKRHRLFESNRPLEPNAYCNCAGAKRAGAKVGGVYGGARSNRWEAENVRHGGYTPSFEVQSRLMGIDWMTQRELYQAIPPKYTELVGRQLLTFVDSLSGAAEEGL
jgi:DNA (cytosine-5)-methyltransferase 1